MIDYVNWYWVFGYTSQNINSLHDQFSAFGEQIMDENNDNNNENNNIFPVYVSTEQNRNTSFVQLGQRYDRKNKKINNTVESIQCIPHNHHFQLHSHYHKWLHQKQNDIIYNINHYDYSIKHVINNTLLINDIGNYSSLYSYNATFDVNYQKSPHIQCNEIDKYHNTFN